MVCFSLNLHGVLATFESDDIETTAAGPTVTTKYGQVEGARRVYNSKYIYDSTSVHHSSFHLHFRQCDEEDPCLSMQRLVDLANSTIGED